MNVIIESCLKTLEKTKFLLDNLDDETLCDSSVSPYYSSIGCHIRHVLDFYDCILNVNSENIIDLTARSRNKEVESECCKAKEYLNSITQKLSNLSLNKNKPVDVIDDLGLGKIKMPYTISAIYSQANSHTIHHYAIINYILEGLNIAFNDSDFGYNPSTPKEEVSN